MKNKNFFKKRNGIPAVKICGLTDPGQAIECVKLGADAIGLVFYRKSPRSVSIDQAFDICGNLPSSVITTGVFVDENYDFIMKRVNACSLKAVQLHGNENSKLVNALSRTGLVVIKALFASRAPYLKDAALFNNANAFLAEYGGKGVLPGGNAEKWDWGMAKQLKTDHALILAGGLTPENVRTAIKSAMPDAVDVSSGVEISHGIKDLEKVKVFIEKVKLAAS